MTGSADKVFDLDAIRNSRVYNVLDQSNNRQVANAWNDPADHFSMLRTYQRRRVVRDRLALVPVRRRDQPGRLAAASTSGPATCSRSPTTPAVPVSVTLRLPTDRRNGIKADTGIFAQDVDDQPRDAERSACATTGSSARPQESDVLAEPVQRRRSTFGKCPDGKNNPSAGCVGTVQNWKDISPRVGVAIDVFGNGRTAVKASFARYVARPGDCTSPTTTTRSTRSA